MDWEEDDYGTDQLGRIGGFSLHAGVAVNTRERKKLERICRYIYTSLDENRLVATRLKQDSNKNRKNTHTTLAP